MMECIVNIRNECLFFLGSWGMNLGEEQTNHTLIGKVMLFCQRE